MILSLFVWVIGGLWGGLAVWGGLCVCEKFGMRRRIIVLFYLSLLGIWLLCDCMS